MKRALIILALALCVPALNNFAQNAGGRPQGGGGAGGNQGQGQGQGQGEQHQRPSPEQLAAHLMETFDANKDGKLSQDELTQALEEMRSHRPPGGEVAGRPTPPPPDKVAAHMIQRFSSDKKGLTQTELVKALAAHHPGRGGPGGGNQGGLGGGANRGAGGKPPGDGAN